MQRKLYEQMVNLLTLKQYTALMGGVMTYADKSRRAKLVSKSKRVHALANQIIALHDQNNLPKA